MAEPDRAPFTADTTIRPGLPVSVPDRALLARRGDLARLDRELRSMDLALEAMRRGRRPDFGVQFDHMEMGEMGRRFSAMAMMTLPLAPWSAGMVRSDIAAMRKDIESMRADREAKQLMARRMAEEMRIMLEAEIEQYRRLESGIAPAYRKSLDAATAAYQEGAGDLFRVLDAWDRWLMARMQSLEHFGQALTLEARYALETGER
jgi:outer membrane protein TolC